MLVDNFDIEELKKRKKKTAISITINKENLDYVKKDMKKNNVDISTSGLFDMLLDNFVKFLKDRNKEKKSNDK